MVLPAVDMSSLKSALKNAKLIVEAIETTAVAVGNIGLVGTLVKVEGVIHDMIIHKMLKF